MVEWTGTFRRRNVEENEGGIGGLDPTSSGLLVRPASHLRTKSAGAGIPVSPDRHGRWSRSRPTRTQSRIGFYHDVRTSSDARWESRLCCCLGYNISIIIFNRQFPRIATILQIKSYSCHFVELEKIRYTCFFFSCANEF